MGGSRLEITFSYFDEKSGTYLEVTTPGNARYDLVKRNFGRFCRAVGHPEEQAEGETKHFPCGCSVCRLARLTFSEQ
jgi:hypothetical protein